jgi:hypothetical protein
MDSIKKQYISRKVVIVGAGDVVIFNCGRNCFSSRDYSIFIVYKEA